MSSIWNGRGADKHLFFYSVAGYAWQVTAAECQVCIMHEGLPTRFDVNG